MEASTVFGIAIAAVISGGILLALASLSARLFSRAPAPPMNELPGLASSLGAATEAVVVARRGGQVVYANDRAKQLFGLNGGAANLNRMARLAQPQDTFFDLFAAEGRTSLTIANHPLEAVSVRLPGEAAQFVVMLRERAGIAGLRSAGQAALGEISQIISSSLDLELTINNILAAVGRITRYDLAEINLWDAEAQGLRPHTRVGDRAFTIALNRKIDVYKLDEGYSGWIARHKRSLLITDAEQYTEARPKVDRAEFPFHSMVGVPLLAQRGAEHELVGTIEIAALDVGVYAEEELALLEALAGQAAVAIRNAQLYAAQAARIAELSGLAQVAQTASAIADPRELYGGLVDRLAKLMSVHLCGILIYDDSERALLSRLPFRGVPDAFIEHYRIPVPPGSAAARIWRESDSWYCNNLAEDPLVAELGLKDLSDAIGVRSTLLVPLIVGGNRLGIVQVSNKINNAVFDDDDARLLRLFAGQAAALIDNARLVREAEQRAERAETLRQISEITGSAHTLAEIYREVITRTVQMVKADFAAVLLLDETKGELAPQPGSLFGGAPAEAEFANIDTDDPAFKYTVTLTRKPFFAWRATRDRRIAAPYQSALAHFRSESVIIVPLVVQDHSIGELWLGARRERAFQRADVPLAATVAAQLASAIERTRLASITDETLRYRVEQLTALTRVGRELNQTIELDHILQTVYDEAVRAARADCGSILLIDSGASPLAARVRLGADGNALTLDAIEADVALSGSSHVVGDLHAPEALAMLTPPTTAAHSGIRSLLIAPIIYQGGAVGIIELHSQKVNAFDQGMMDFSQALAAQAAIAVGNAQRYEEQIQRGELLRHRADQLAQLLQISRAVRSDRPLTTNLEAIAFGVQEAVGFNVVVISVMEPGTDTLHRTAAAGVPLADFEQLKLLPQSWPLFAPALAPEFSISQSFYVPHDRTPPELAQVDAVKAGRGAEAAEPGQWHRNDFLFVPLTGSGGQAVGMMSLDDPRDGRAPGRLLMETVEIFANQAALAIENARLYQSAQSRAAELSRSLAELQKSYQDLDAVSRTLSRKELELSRLIEHTESRAKRLLALHRIASETAETRDEAAFLELTTRSTTAEMNLDVCVIALLAQDSLRVAAQAGAAETTAALSGQLSSHNPLSQIIELRTPLLATDLGQLGWGESNFVRSLGLRSFVGAPIVIAGKLAGAALVGSRSEQAPFTNEDIDVFLILAGQIGVGIENIRLHDQTQTLYTTVQNYAADLEKRVAERTRDLAKERDRVETLLRITSELSASLDLDRILNRALTLVNDVIGGAQGALFLLDPLSDQLIYRAALGVGFELPPGGQPSPFRKGEGLVGWVIKRREPIIVADLAADERWVRRPQSEHHKSAVCVPLISSDDALGAMVFYSDKTNAFNEDQLRLIAAAASQVTSAINNAELYRLIRDQAERLGGMLRANQVEATKSRAILESVADGVMVADYDGKIILFNATAERILKLNRADVLNRPVNDFMGLYGAGAKNLAEAINGWTVDPTSYQPGDFLSERIELDDRRIVSVLLTPVTSTDEYLGSVSIFRDITREVEVDRLKTEFVTTVSHELRTPMTSIKGYADLLLMGAAGVVTPDQHRFLDVIKSAADRLGILLDDLLDISKIESGRVELDLAPVLIADLLGDAADHVRGRIKAQERPMTVIVDAPRDLPPVLGDRQRLMQIVTNLADNAFNYTESGGAITLAARREADAIVISVSDTGIGISPEERARIFERFYRGENLLVMASAGTGLGLSIVQKLVDMHGGRIWAESEGVGRGSTFYVLLKLPPMS